MVVQQQHPTEWARSHRHLCLATFDVAAWGCALALQAWARPDFDMRHDAFVYWGVASLLFLLAAAAVGLHRGRASVASLEETLLLGAAVTITCGAFVIVSRFVMSRPLPVAVPVTTAFLALVLMWWGRVAWRTQELHARVRPASGRSVPVVVLGAGDAGRQLVRSMLTTPGAAWRPAALLDDDRAKRNLRLSGVPVRGGSSDIARVAEETGARILVIAIPSMGAPRLRAISFEALSAGLEVKVLPGVTELLGNPVGLQDVRDLDLVDLLGRRQIETDIASIADYLRCKRVLVTGAGGSIGSELCRQLQLWGPAELLMLDHDDSALHAVQASLADPCPTRAEILLADIRDAEEMQRILGQRRPHVVFHAAALKHVPILEAFPSEAVKTNVWGTLNVLEAALSAGVDKFVNISTDKAADPISVLGYSKRITERLTAHFDLLSDNASFLSVRFGNVLGSRGSVLGSFAAQIAAGGPVTVTHPDVTRYFMTVQEAIQLVIQAGAIGTSGDALVLDMGEPVNIDRLARKLVQLSGRDIAIEYTSLRAGEKLSESLFATSEVRRRTAHPMISRVAVPPESPASVRAIATASTEGDVTSRLRSNCRAEMGALRAKETLAGVHGSPR